MAERRPRYAPHLDAITRHLIAEAEAGSLVLPAGPLGRELTAWLRANAADLATIAIWAYHYADTGTNPLAGSIPPETTPETTDDHTH
jgi:hypothetical protein